MKYGTAGFRDEATKLIEISYDIGRIIAYLTLNSNENYGIMITASHNEYTDNGVKIVGYDGSMIQKANMVGQEFNFNYKCQKDDRKF